MNKNESEKIIKDTIEYANREIMKNKKNCIYCIVGIVLAGVLLLMTYFIVFVRESSVKYSEGLVDVVIPYDKGIDIKVELSNYKKANVALVRTDDNNYDLYINIKQTIATKILKDSDKSNNLIRVGNGIIVDFQGEQVLSYIPEKNTDESIKHIYYVNDYSNNLANMSDKDLNEYKDKTLIWER